MGAGSSSGLAQAPGAPTKPTAARARPAREPPLSTRVSSSGRVDRARDRPTAQPWGGRVQPRLRGVRVLPGLVEAGLCWGSVEAAGGPLCPSHAPQHRCFASTTAGASSPPPELRWRCTPAREADHTANHSRLPRPVLHEPAGTRLWLETACRQHRASLPGSWLCLLHAPLVSEDPLSDPASPPLGEGLSGGRNLSPIRASSQRCRASPAPPAPHPPGLRDLWCLSFPTRRYCENCSMCRCICGRRRVPHPPVLPSGFQVTYLSTQRYDVILGLLGYQACRLQSYSRFSRPFAKCDGGDQPHQLTVHWKCAWRERRAQPSTCVNFKNPTLRRAWVCKSAF